WHECGSRDGRSCPRRCASRTYLSSPGRSHQCLDFPVLSDRRRTPPRRRTQAAACWYRDLGFITDAAAATAAAAVASTVAEAARTRGHGRTEVGVCVSSTA